MGRVVVYEDRGSSSRRPFAGFYATVDLDSGERVFVQLAKTSDGPRAMVSRTRLGGLLPGALIGELSKADLLNFATSTPGVDSEERSRALLRRLVGFVLISASLSELSRRLSDDSVRSLAFGPGHGPELGGPHSA